MSRKNVFLPRSVVCKPGNTKAKLPPKTQKCEENDTRNNGDTNDDVIKQFRFDQRWPDAEEPTCVICERYGEYVCDLTDEDVCSIECKRKHLKNQQQSKAESRECFNEHYSKSVQWQPKFDNNLQNWDVARQKFHIKVNKPNLPLVTHFDQFDFPTQLHTNLSSLQYIAPRAVQMQVMPLAVLGHDLLVSAETSSGKTASFLLPIIWAIQKCVGALDASHEFCKHAIAMVVAPTRELCMQIEQQAKAVARQLPNISTALLIGGVPIPQQLHRLKHRIQLVIGTPGRIKDILANHEQSLSLKQMKIVVVDEVDVMLQLGFESQISSILKAMENPQLLMFSATLPPSTEKLARNMLSPSAVMVNVGQSGVATRHVKKIVIWVEEGSKRKKLFDIINEPRHFQPPMLVFVASKKGAEILAEAITERFALSCRCMHGDLSQEQRTQVLEEFAAGAHGILVATNVLGRGIHLDNVSQVLLFDFPQNLEEYVHQVGRSIRKGVAMAFINNTNKALFNDLVLMFKKADDNLPNEVVNSPYVIQQQNSLQQSSNSKVRGKKRSSAGNNDEEDVTSQNVLSILKRTYKV